MGSPGYISKLLALNYSWLMLWKFSTLCTVVATWYDILKHEMKFALVKSAQHELRYINIYIWVYIYVYIFSKKITIFIANNKN